VNFTQAEKKVQEAKSQMKSVNPRLIHNLNNIKIFAKALTKGPTPFGEGMFGKVFDVEAESYHFEGQTRKLAFKEVLFSNDCQKDPNDTQSVLASDIENSTKIGDLDPNGLYFPEFFGHFEVTDYFNSVYQNGMPSNAKRFLKPDSKTDMAVLITDFLELEAFQYFKLLEKRSIPSFFHTRVKLLLNLGHALESVFDTFFHCDIKPENIMFKRINEDEVLRLKEFGIHRLELHPGEMYQVKIIDFGLSEFGSLDERVCDGGTPDFLPMEFLISRKSDPTFDLFALAMMFLDMELSELGFGAFSAFNNYTMSTIIPQLDFPKDDDKYRMLNFPATKLFGDFWKNPKYNPLFVTAFKNFSNKLIPFIQKYSQSGNLYDVKYDKFLLSNARVPLIFGNVGLRILWTEVYKNELMPRRVKKFSDLLAKAQENMEALKDKKDSEEYKQQSEKAEYFTLMMNHVQAEADSRIKFNLLMLDIVEKEASQRMSLSDTLVAVNDILEQFMSVNESDLKRIFQLRRHYNLRFLNDKGAPTDKSLASYVYDETQKRSSFKLLDEVRMLLI
jgi:serine/threonine protein kinase